MQSEHNTNQEAQAKLQRSEGYLAADPGNPELMALVIDLSLSLGQVERAEKHAAAALAQLPNDAFFQSRMGNVLIASKQWAQAEQLFAGLLAQHPDVNLAYNLAYAQVWQGRHADAYATMAPFAKLLDLAPAAVTLMVRALHHMGELDQAIALVAAQIDRCQGDPVFLAAASVVYLDAGQLEEAEHLSVLSLESGHKRPLEALVVGGSLALARTDTAAAAKQFEEALALNPTEGRSWSGLGMASLLKRDLPGARAQLEKAVQYLPGHIGTWHTLGWTQIFQGDLAGAEQVFRQALALDRNFGDSHGGLAVVQAMQGARELAEASIARALGLDPQSLSARYAQMVLAGQTEDPVKFRALAMRLLASRQGAFGQNLAEIVKKFEAE
ncbi:tetratricopeptide repeat protein [Oxalobacteraceae bacterium]|nr:tetratricopeptide repeat protein [Oxalobacteraceae bacterium]